jgi:hypothetical protein
VLSAAEATATAATTGSQEHRKKRTPETTHRGIVSALPFVEATTAATSTTAATATTSTTATHDATTQQHRQTRPPETTHRGIVSASSSRSSNSSNNIHDSYTQHRQTRPPETTHRGIVSAVLFVVSVYPLLDAKAMRRRMW